MNVVQNIGMDYKKRVESNFCKWPDLSKVLKCQIDILFTMTQRTKWLKTHCNILFFRIKKIITDTTHSGQQ